MFWTLLKGYKLVWFLVIAVRLQTDQNEGVRQCQTTMCKPHLLWDSENGESVGLQWRGGVGAWMWHEQGRWNMHQAKEGQSRWKKRSWLAFSFWWLWCWWCFRLPKVPLGEGVLIPSLYSFPQLTVFFHTEPRAKEVGRMVPLSWPAFLDDSHSFLVS